MKINRLLPLLVAVVALPIALPADITNPRNIYSDLDRAYKWQSTRLEEHRNQSIIGWKHATFYTGVMELYRRNNKPHYLELLRDISIDHHWKMLEVNQMRWRHADNHLIGETYINIYLEDDNPSPFQLLHVNQIFNRMIDEPVAGRVLFNWCDALFMSPPVWAQLATLHDDLKYMEELDKLWWDATEFLYNTEWNLYYRDSDYFNSLEANGMPTFWGRGNGWVMGGLARVLKYMPQNYAGRDAYIELFIDMSERLAELQMENGAWPASLLYPERFNFAPEISATGLFVYSIAWGVNNGILDKDQFGPVIERGWEVLHENLNPDGSIRNIQRVGKDPVPWGGGYTEREYGYGAFILAGVEMADYYSENWDPNTWEGYEIWTLENGQQWVDTGTWLGLIEVSRAPYIYSPKMGNWLYIREMGLDLSAARGGWVRVIK